MLMLGTYAEDNGDGMTGKVAIVEKALGFRLDLVRSADWRSNWADVQSDYTVKLIRDRLAPRHVQHMSVMFPLQYGKSGSKDGWTRGAKGEFHSQWVASFKNKLAALPKDQTTLYLSTSYETTADFWQNDIKACGGEAAYVGAVKQARKAADEAEKAFPGKKIVLVHNPVNERGRTGNHADFKATFADGAHGAIFLNCYMKPQYQGGTLDSVLDYWLNAYCGINSVIALAKQKGVPWGLAEVGFLSDDKQDIRDFCRKLGDRLIQDIDTMAVFLPWPSDKDYPGNIFAGRSPKAAEGVVNLMRRLNEARKGASPAPSPTPKPAPAAPEADLLRRIHEGAYAERVRNPKTALHPVEGIAWGARVKLGEISGSAPDGKAPLDALLAIYRALDDDRLSAAERVLVTPWRIEAEDILEAAGLLRDEPAPQPEPEQPSAELEALKARVADLERQLAAERARIKAVQAALAA